MKKEKKFTPDWRHTPPKPGSARAIFKWGDPNGFKHPNARLYAAVKEKFQMTDKDFIRRQEEGDKPAVCKDEPNLEARQIEWFRNLLGRTIFRQASSTALNILPAKPWRKPSSSGRAFRLR